MPGVCLSSLDGELVRFKWVFLSIPKVPDVALPRFGLSLHDFSPFTLFIRHCPREDIAMKLIVTGASGYVGSELIRQSLRVPEITSVIALARKPVQVPDKLEEGSDPSKLKSVVVEDYGKYPDEVKKEFEDADACIW